MLSFIHSYFKALKIRSVSGTERSLFSKSAFRVHVYSSLLPVWRFLTLVPAALLSLCHEAVGRYTPFFNNLRMGSFTGGSTCDTAISMASMHARLGWPKAIYHHWHLQSAAMDAAGSFDNDFCTQTHIKSTYLVVKACWNLETLYLPVFITFIRSKFCRI